MRKANCIIIDDDDASRNAIEQYIESIDFICLSYSLSDASEGLHILNNDNSIMLVLISASMKGVAELDFFSHVKPSHCLIIISDNTLSAFEAFEKNAFDFLLKPVSFSRFLRAATKVRPIILMSEKRVAKYLSSPLTDEEKNKLFNDIIEYVEKEKFYLNAGVTVDMLASRINSNRSYVSQVINEKKSCNFYSFINEYRIKEAMRLLHNSDLVKLSIEGIAYSVGFNSKSSFFSAFRKIAGLNPSDYQKREKERE